jgi:SAM-dependent methyltransferase
MDWTAGYASDVEYVAGFYREQAPSYLNFACVLNDVEPVDLSGPFTYFELGFGRGVTVNILAATYPQGSFYATDFNPAHVAGARQMAASAGLDNLTLLENSFEELAQGACADLPQFDFITLHGIYTWVTADNQAHIQAFLQRYLKPGGIVYLSYNAMPGWSAATPLQRLIVEHADVHPGRSDGQIRTAATFITTLADTGSGYFSNNAAIADRLNKLVKADAHYLVHEYMHKHWQPLYHADVARALASAKLDYAGSANLALAYPNLYLPADTLGFLHQIADPLLRETAKDYLFNTGFRKDIFVRGKRSMTPLRKYEWLTRFGFALTVPRELASANMKLHPADVNGKAALYDPFLDALASGATAFATLRALPALAGLDLAVVLQIAALLVASGQVAVYVDGTGAKAGPRCTRLNQVIGDAARYGDDIKALASPLLGNGINASHFERVVYAALAANKGASNVDAVTDKVAGLLNAMGRRMVKEGVTLTSVEENYAEVKKEVAQFLSQRLPLWRQLGLT